MCVCVCVLNFKIKHGCKQTWLQAIKHASCNVRINAASGGTVPEFKILCNPSSHPNDQVFIPVFSSLVPRLDGVHQDVEVSQCVIPISLSCLPPGTGKSSIVCAMCLGLGGRPTLLGRAKEVCTAVDYVFWDIFCTPPSHFPSLFFSSITPPLSLPYPWISHFISPPPLSLFFFFSYLSPLLSSFLSPFSSLTHLCRSRILSNMARQKGLSRLSCMNHEEETLSLDVT